MEKQSKNNNKSRRRKNRQPFVKRKVRVPLSGGELISIDTPKYVEPTRIAHFRKYNNANLLSELQVYNKHVRDRYLMGLIHPDIAVKDQIPIKMYSDVPIPTASIGFHEQYNFQTSALGTFLLTWTPNFVYSQPRLTTDGLTQYSCITFNNAIGLTGSAVVAGNVFTLGSYAPNVDFQKYRLVSAIIKVQYNGPILNQSGVLLSCAAYDGFGVAVGDGVTSVTTLSQALADRYGVFSTIQNGLWNETTDITSDSTGLECLWLPTDPDSMIFDRVGAYKGTARTTPGLISAVHEGAYINYVVAGRNLPVSSTCILVDVYYNYEVIADPSAAPFLRSSVDTVYDSKYAESVKTTMANAVRSGTLIRKTTKSSSSGFMDKLGQIASIGLEYLPMILGALA